MRRSSLWLIGLLVVACGDEGSTTTPPPSVDAGPTSRDAGFAMDAGPPDAGTVDAGVVMLGEVNVDVTQGPPERLSAYGLLAFASDGFIYNDRVVPYTLATPLFSDFARKARAVYVPPGGQMAYDPRDAFEMPVGSAIVKTFYFGTEDAPEPVETRVLVRYEDGWRAFPYRWMTDGTPDAEYFVRGEARTLEVIDFDGNPRSANYLIPQKNQCVECHELLDENDERYIAIIGPKARYLNRDNVYDGETKNQLTHLDELGMLSGLPPLDEVEAAFDFESLRGTSTTALDAETLDRAARDYLDINCAHCHNPLGTNGQTSRLFLDTYNEDPFNLGICKEPGSAGPGAGGRRYNIVPGDAEASILVFRTETEEVGAMMPLLGRSLADDLGARLVRGWVDAMPPQTCE